MASTVATATVHRSASDRLMSIDIVRGLVMVLMAIDHVRVYSGQPAGGPTPGIFFTRWITHFVAPAFVFLAGTSSYLYGAKLPNRAALSRFLVTRGLWLVFLELTIIRLSWTFNFDYAHYILGGVIWMIGWCMVIMAVMIHLSVTANAAIGVAIIALHNCIRFIPGLGEAARHSALAPLWQVLYFGGNANPSKNGPPLLILFVIVPWIGVMMAGYAFGKVMQRPSEERRRLSLRLGIALTAAFVVLRAIDVYGDPNHWRQVQEGNTAPALLRFLGTSKYPASLLFLLMTLGPMFIALALAERARSGVAALLRVFGRVPMFYYLLHIPVIHAGACFVSVLRDGRIDPWLLTNHPLAPGPLPDGYMWSLPRLYLVWGVAVMVLYVPCRWYAAQKARHPDSVLRYI